MLAEVTARGGDLQSYNDCICENVEFEMRDEVRG